MIKLDTELEGKRALYGQVCRLFGDHGLVIGGNWDFDQGMFDTTLYSDGGESIYLRLPFDVESGMLDEEDALLVFKTPFVIKHIANIGLDDEESPALATTGLDQFQSPEDKDAPIHQKTNWAVEGEQKVAALMDDMQFSQL